MNKGLKISLIIGGIATLGVITYVFYSREKKKSIASKQGLDAKKNKQIILSRVSLAKNIGDISTKK